MSLVAGVDSSTQSCTVVIRDAATGEHVRSGRAPHPPGTEVDPAGWWDALQAALAEAGGLDGVDAIAVAGQQHGMVCLDADGEVVRPALLWNDTRSAQAAADLVAELGAQAWADATGTLPVASITAAKLRWLATHEPENAARTAAVCLPHDWLTWKLRGTGALDDLVTDRGDASGTGYFSAVTNAYRLDLLERRFGRSDVVLPRVLGPGEAAGRTPDGVLIGPGTGDNAGAALGLGAGPGDIVVSLGHVRRRVGGEPHPDRRPHRHHRRVRLRERRVPAAGVHAQRGAGARRGHPACSASTTRAWPSSPSTPRRARAAWCSCRTWRASARRTSPTRPARCTASRSAPPRPRTWRGPPSRGCCAGSRTRSTPCSRRTCRSSGRSWSAGRRGRRPSPGSRPRCSRSRCDRPTPGEYVADGAARQAAWVLSEAAAPPEWAAAGQERFTADPTPHVRERYAQARDLTVNQLA